MTKIDRPSLDAVDYRLLKQLSRRGRASDVALGESINLSSTAVARRRRILEENEIIQGYGAVLDLIALGLGGVAIVSFELNSQSEETLLEFERAIANCPSVSYAGFITGDTDFLAVLHVRSLSDYDNIYRRELSVLPHVARIRSSFVIREVVRERIPPIVFNEGRS